MSKQDTQGEVKKNAQDVSQPDDKKVAPEKPTSEDDKQTPDTQPKDTDADAAEEDAILPDEDEGDEGTEPESKQPDDGDEPDDGGDDDEGDEPDKSGDPQDADSEKKKQNEEGYWKRQAQKKDEVIDQLSEALQNNYIAQGKDDAEKRTRTLEAKDFIRDVRDARSQLVADNQRVSTELPVFNPSSPDYIGEEAAQRVMTQYARDNVIMQPIQKPDGTVSDEVVGYKQPLYEYMSEMAEIIGTGKKPTATEPDGDEPKETKDQIEARVKKNERKMKAKAEVTGGTKPKAGKSDDDDDFLKGFNSVD